MRRLLVLSVLAAEAVACDRSQVTVAPEAPASASPSTAAPRSAASSPSQSSPPVASAAPAASADSAGKTTIAAPPSASAAPAPELDASKRPASPPASNVCEGEAREGCVPKNDPFGFVARE